MGVLKRRTRLISFRLSDEEYQALLQITAAQGARSISDFSRCSKRPTNQNIKRLYRIFFKTYTEKVWGIPCTTRGGEYRGGHYDSLGYANNSRRSGTET
jgi:UDP-galactopyranose mutase